MQSNKCDASSESALDRLTAVYARTAAVQADQSSLEAQVDACVRQAAEDGVPLVGDAYVYRDQQSGVQLDRPGLNQLRRAVRAGEIGLVYAYSLDRPSRDAGHLCALIEEFASVGR